MKTVLDLEQNDLLAQQLAMGLEQIAGLMSHEKELAERARTIRHQAERIAADRFTIVVVGDFNRGKSTLINAMLGQKILPQKPVPSTAIVTKLVYAEEPGVKILFKDPASPVANMSLDDFKRRYILSEEDHHGRDKVNVERFQVVDYAEVQYPLELCRHRVELVDSPGLNDDPVRTDRTSRFLEKADAVVMILNATMPMTEQERNFIDFVRDVLRQTTFFFVINYWNLISEMTDDPEDQRRVEERFRTLLSSYCLIDGINRYNERVFPVNAKQALDLRVAGITDNTQLQDSGVPQFEMSLKKLLLEERAAVRNEFALQTARAAHIRYGEYRTTQIKLLGQSVEELERKQKAIEPELDRLRRLRKHIEAFLRGRGLEYYQWLLDSLREHMRSADIDATVETFDLSEITERLLAVQPLLDWMRSEEDKLENRIRAQLQPQVEHFIKGLFKSWQTTVASVQMKTEQKTLIDYLTSEADEYRQILHKIGETTDGQDSPQTLDVDEIVANWLTSEWDVGNPVVKLEAAGIAIDIAPLVAGIIAEMMFHAFAHMIPVIGTIASVVMAVWRQGATVNKMKSGIIAGLRQAVQSIPAEEQSAQLRQQVDDAFNGLAELVTRNIAQDILERENSLITAIENKQREQYSFDSECNRLAAVEDNISAIVDSLQVAAFQGAPGR